MISARLKYDSSNHLHRILIGLAMCKAIFAYLGMIRKEYPAEKHISDHSPEVLIMYQFCMIFWKAIWDIFLCFLQDVFLWINANREWLFDGLFPSLLSNTITLLLFFIGLIIKKGESKPIEPPRKNRVFDFEVIDESPPLGQSFKTGSLIV